ncbi:MAG: Hsp20/alpha crystallin family protein [Thermodesulfobacteriota bacterium]
MALVSFRGTSPLENLVQLQSALDRLLQSPSRGLDLGPSGGNVFPPINLFADRDGRLVVRAEVPGLRPDAVEITVEPRRLTIAGERLAPEGAPGSYHRRERSFGRFSRTVQLPADLDPASATAEVRQGVLTVRIDKRAEAKPRRIEVTPRGPAGASA